jgi:Carboxypeptidase regulatory-like domain/TonB dependent receptor
MRNRFFVVLALAILCALPIITMAQQGTASVTGLVTDTSGAVVPGADIKVVDTKTNTTYLGKTGSDGTYRIVDIPPGPGYSLTVTKDSFQTFVLNNLYLPVATPTTQNIQLQLGALSQTVEVTASGSAVSLNTTDATIGNNFDMHEVESLPVEIRDDAAALLRLQPGVVSAQGGANVDPSGSRDGSVGGARADQNNIIVDGVEATDFTAGTAFATQAAIPVDAIQEFSTQVGDPTPAYGGRSGAQTLETTKSGSNDWHGSASEYNRTAATEANTFFNNKTGTVPRTALTRNQFGGNVGGPAIKDKLFFFFDYGGRRDNEQANVLRFVPFPHVQLGEIAYINRNAGCTKTARLTSADVSTNCVTILSAAQVQALDPCSMAGGCPNAPGFAAPGIAPALLDLFKNRYPAPNDYTVGDGKNTAGFRFNTATPLKLNDYVSRVDYNINGSNKLFARFNFVNLQQINLLNQFKGDPITAPEVIKDRGWALGETWTINSRTINQFTYGETHATLAQPIDFNPSGGLVQLSFFDGLLSTPFVRQSAQGQTNPVPTFRDDLTLIRGKHTISIGGEWHRITGQNTLTNDFNFVQEGAGGNIPSLDSTLEPANILLDPSAKLNFDDFFISGLGVYNNLQAAINYNKNGTALPAGSAVVRHWRFNQYAGYLQDAWRIRGDLTATVGVRYQYDSVPYETSGNQASFLNTNLASLISTRVSNGLNGVSGLDVTPELTYQLTGAANGQPPIYSPERHDFSPRLALAWNPSSQNGILGRVFGDRKTVVRASTALIYDETVTDAVVRIEDQSNYLFGNTVAATFGTGGTPTSVLETAPRFNSISTLPFPVVAPPFQNPLTPSAIFNDGIDPHLHTPYSIVASLGMQRELPGGFQLELDYYGRFGRKLFTLADGSQIINFVDPASGQSLVQAFTVLEKAALLQQTTVSPQPFLENQMDAALGTTCQAAFGMTCSNFVLTNNAPSLAIGSTGGVVDALANFGQLPPNVGQATQFLVNGLGSNLGSSSYNALFTTLRKKFSNGLQFDFNYTYSHSIDNGSAIANNNGNFIGGATSVFCDATNTHVCRGNSEFDATHQVTADFVYDLPFGRGQMIGRDSNRWLNEAIGGWHISGIETWRTGLAVTVDSEASTTSLAADGGAFFTGTKADVASHIHVDTANNNQIQFYANPAAAVGAFSPVTGLQTGSRDTLRGPHYSNLDVSVLKDFPLVGERYKLQFRADAFNVFNHTNFAQPNIDINSGAFGVISDVVGEEPSRVMQFSLKFQF